MRELIDRLAQAPDARIEQGPSSSTISVAKRPDLHFQITVPHDVLEWFVTVRDATGAELWSDWNDYAGYVSKAAEDKQALASEMIRDIEWFVSTLAAAEDFRVTTQRFMGLLRQKSAEWCVAGRWQPVSMAAPTE